MMIIADHIRSASLTTQSPRVPLNHGGTTVL